MLKPAEELGYEYSCQCRYVVISQRVCFRPLREVIHDSQDIFVAIARPGMTTRNVDPDTLLSFSDNHWSKSCVTWHLIMMVTRTLVAVTNFGSNVRLPPTPVGVWTWACMRSMPRWPPVIPLCATRINERLYFSSGIHAMRSSDHRLTPNVGDKVCFSWLDFYIVEHMTWLQHSAEGSSSWMVGWLTRPC